MPYFVTDSHPDCSSWAVVKQDGSLHACAASEQAAIDNMVAVSLAEEIEPGGTYSRNFRAAPDELKVGDFVRWSASGGAAQGRITKIERDGKIAVPDSSFTINGDADDPAALIRIFRENEDGWQATETLVGHRFSTLTKIADLRSETRAALGGDKFTTEAEANARAEQLGCEGSHSMDENGETIYMPCSTHGRYEELTSSGEAYRDDESEIESREVNLTPPAYMRAAARRGLEFNSQGLAGDGLTDATVREARAMANGNVTADKWVRLSAWIARHLDDLDAPAANPENDGYPSPGVVAHLLWGSGPSKSAARRAMEYADGVVARLEAENEGRASGEAVSKIETRTSSADFELREDGQGGMTFEGYAAIFDSPSEPLPFTERIAKGAFRGSLKQRNDIKLLWNHETGLVLGSTRAGSLQLSEDDRGLRVSAQLPNTSAGRDAAELLRRGDVDSMSFGFSVPRNGDSWNNDGTERTLKAVRLHEVSIVAFPAYAATAGTTQVRGLDKVAQRAGIDDSDALADALLKIESGDTISLEEKSMITKVIDTLAPENSHDIDFDGEAWLQLKKKKLQLLKQAK